MLEASAFTAVSTEVFKYSLGRQRPNETTDPDQWFAPAMHSRPCIRSLAFAIGTVFAESGSDRYRWLRRVLGYGVAGATAYAARSQRALGLRRRGRSSAGLRDGPIHHGST